MADAGDASSALRRDVGMGVVALLASGGTLVCCVLPAVMVSLGAGAALASLLSVVPALVWLSAHKAGVFGVAAGMLAVSGLLLLRARRLPCPADPALARQCTRLRRVSVGLWGVAFACTAIGVLFAFVLPRLS